MNATMVGALSLSSLPDELLLRVIDFTSFPGALNLGLTSSHHYALVGPSLPGKRTEYIVTAVRNAVKLYRSEMVNHNRRVFELLVGDTKLEYPAGEDTPGTLPDRKMERIKMYLCAGDLPRHIRKPDDVLRHFDSLVRPYHLDGTQGDVSPDELPLRRRYLAMIDEALRGQAPVGFAGELSVPLEFRVLFEQVSSIIAPGLPYHAMMWGVCFYGSLDHEQEEMSEIMLKGDAGWDKACEAGLHEDGWEVAAGWRTGELSDTNCFAVFCRNEDKGKPWQWRYKVSWIEDPFEPLQDSIVRFLEWFAHYDEADLEEIRREIE